jgi:arylsulfatase A-like enzyme
MFTSLHVSTHGILDNRGYKLSPQATTLAEVLREAGYETAGFTSVHHMHFELNGLGQGFDHHWGSKGISSAEEVNQQVFKWLNRRDSDRPFFLFVHYFDTHTPYTPPPEFLEPFYQGDPRDPSNTSLQEMQLQPDQVESFATWLDGITDIEYVKALYDGAILYLDSRLRELENRLRRDNLLANSIFVFTADHGESLVEHGIYFGHLGLYEPSIQIPLLIQSPMQSSRVVRGTAQSVDIAPTVLGLAGLGIPVEMEGRDLTQWTASGEHLPEDQTIYSEHAHAGAVSMKQGGWKYI